MSNIIAFNQSSTPGKNSYRNQESLELYNKVITNYKPNRFGEDELSASDVIRFVNHLQYGAFGKGMADKGLATFPLEFRLRLYEIVAHDQKPYWLQRGDQKAQSRASLTFLSEQLGLTDSFYHKANKLSRDFLSPGNIGKLDTAWKAAGHRGTFSDLLVRAQRPSTTGGVSVARKKELLTFMHDEMNRQAGRECSLSLSPGLMSGNSLCGGYASTDLFGNHHVAINSDYLDQQFGSVIDTLFHELDHIHQHELGADYLNGEITEDHPDYTAARVFAANRRAYIHPDDNLYAYRVGAMETSARALGANARKLAEEFAGICAPSGNTGPSNRRARNHWSNLRAA